MPIESAQNAGLLTIADVAKLLNVSVVSVRRLYDARKIPFIKVGGSIRFTVNDVNAYIDQQRVASVG